MNNNYKKDYDLGLKVHQHLLNVGCETPCDFHNEFQNNGTRIQIASKFKDIMECLNLNLEDDSLVGTPDRYAKMFVDEMFYGLNYRNFPKMTVIENKMLYDEMVLEKDIKVLSNCEHHFVTIDGLCSVAYIPHTKVLGISKINRLVDFFAKRPQVQERLAEQIFHALEFILGTDNIACHIEATHYCVKSRGVGDQTSKTSTAKLGGVFKTNSAVRSEFYNLITRR